MKRIICLSLASMLALGVALPAAAKTHPKPVAKAPAKAVKEDKKAAAKRTAAKSAKAEETKHTKNAKLAHHEANKPHVVKTQKVVAKAEPAHVRRVIANAKGMPVARPLGTVARPEPVARPLAQIKPKDLEIVTKPAAPKARPTPTARRVSYGRAYGLDNAYDPLSLRASVALVVDQNSWTTIYDKNAHTQLPIASITKLMTAMLTLDSGVNLDEPITITAEDANHYRSSRLAQGITLPRREVLLLMLMSSENRAAHALGRTYPGGLEAFVQAMNTKAAMLGMTNAQFVDPSGLSPSNQASAMDLAKMVNAASQYKLIRQLSTTESATVYTPMGRELVYHNSNRLITRNMGWNIGMQKTGTLSAAGKCVVVQAVINGSPKIIVLLDSKTADSRVTDAQAIKNWLESSGAGTVSSIQFLVNQG